jgi:CDP-diacylglycerol--serine O-phosphatidyltransferase
VLRLVSHYYGPEGSVTILGPEADPFFAKALWTIAAIYVCCTALRLARFNAETPSAAEEDHRNFKGLPSPGAGGTIVSLILLHQSLLAAHGSVEDDRRFALVFAFGFPLVTLFCSAAMVSTLRYAHFVNRVLRTRRTFHQLVRLVVVVIVGVFFPHVVLALGFVGYALSGPFYSLWLVLRRGRVAQLAPSSSDVLP